MPMQIRQANEHLDAEPITAAEREPLEYEVGYGKPPLQHRWKPNQSGNPNGRPKKSKKNKKPPKIALPGIYGKFINLLQTERVFMKNGKKVKCTYEDLAAEKLLGDVFGSSLDRSRALRSLYANDYPGILDRMEEMRAELMHEDDISPEIEREIIEMAKKYFEE